MSKKRKETDQTPDHGFANSDNLHNAHVLFSPALERNSFEIDLNQIVEARNELLERLCVYSASLNRELLILFELNIANPIRNLQIDLNLAEIFISKLHQIKEEGPENCGPQIIKELKSLLKTDIS
jgi:hypothetical protein